MKTAALFLTLLFFLVTRSTTEGLVETSVQSQCRDRYLWIHVVSPQTPRFQAVDGNGVHVINDQLASQCGYTVSALEVEDVTTFRASYYSCFTHNQNDEVFTFRFNVMVSDDGSKWVEQAVSVECSASSWTHREVTCEDHYMEVNVNRQSSCEGQQGGGDHMWPAAFSQAQKMATPTWQLLFLQRHGQMSSMSISEAQTRGYSLTTTDHRVVLRSRYKQQHANVMMVDGIPVEVVQVSLIFRKRLVVVMIDMSMACTRNSGSFDGSWLQWDIPRVMTPLVEEVATFESQMFSVGVEGVLLEEVNATTRGISLVQRGSVVQIMVPFGAEGGHRKSLVVNDTYHELYTISMLYEHVFSLRYEDGSSTDTRHRLLRVLETPPLCRPLFTLHQTDAHFQLFSVYLGNVPADVILQEVWINRKQLMLEDAERIIITPVLHTNGSRAYELQLPFEDAAVHSTYLGGGVVQYSADLNFTLTIVPQRSSYHHHTSVSTRVSNTFPPQVTAQCSNRGITFNVNHPPRAMSLWEVGVDHEPLTSQLVAQRRYRLHNDSHRTSLEVPVFSVGYTYEDINLSNFYGTFQLVLRDTTTLEVQTSVSKRCLFKTEDMMDGTMTVVTSPTFTWPTVRPDRTSLLDRTCGPKQADGSRVLFEFNVNSCGTRAMVGESSVVYENEIIHDRQLIPDGHHFISRESQFKLTLRCFYPLSAVSRLSVDRNFRAGAPGFGSIQVFGSLDSASQVPGQKCIHQISGNPSQSPAAGGAVPQPKPGSIHSTEVSSALPDLQTFQTVPQQVSSHPGQLTSHEKDQSVSSHRFPTYDQVPDSSIQLSNIKTLSSDSGVVTEEHPGHDGPTWALSNSLKLNQYLQSLQDNLSFSLQLKPSSDAVNNQPTSTATHWVNHDPERIGSIDRRNTETFVSNVRNMRIKPLSKLVGSGRHLKPQPPVGQISDPPQSGLVLTQVCSHGNHQTPQELQGHRGSNLGQDHRPVGVKVPPSAVIQQVRHQNQVLVQKGKTRDQVQAGAYTGNRGGPESVSAQRKVFLLAGVSHVRVRPGPGLSGRFQTQDQSRQQTFQSPVTRGETSKMSVLGITPQTTSKTLVQVGEHEPTDHSDKDQNPTAGPDGFTGFDGPGSPGLDLKIHSRSNCESLYGSSVHQGIVRGTNNFHTQHCKGFR
uniref:uncharacterized protein LOC122783871 isoform X2 n=1 Tax=Solea senegalensis TaxID=28829 RepID=UPI001CD8BDE8|nr:uncharacterized protein LOC122783871 isoform X2 [Solea senegalensis]